MSVVTPVRREFARMIFPVVLPRVTAFLLLVTCGASGFAAPARQLPNVLVIVSDDQRPDTIHALGNPHIATPNLDRLVKTGATFTRAIAANPLCVPSRAEIMTGTTGFRNGSPPFGTRIDPSLVLWADAMRKGGYKSWYSGKWMNDGTPRTRGYDETSALFSSGGSGGKENTHPTAHNGRPTTGYGGWTFKTNEGKAELDKGVGLTPLTDRHIADGAIALIKRRPAQPFFLHVNFTAPHDPLHLPPGYEDRYKADAMPLPVNFRPEHPFDHGNAGGRDELLLDLPRQPPEIKRELAAYYAVISHMDAQVGRILEALKATQQDASTIVIFTSDHGLALGSHGLMGKQNMYEHSIGVPLIFSGPGLPVGRRFAAQTTLRDLYPTVCDLVGIPIPDTVEGRSLVPVLTGAADAIHPEVYAYYHRSENEAELPVQRMVRTDRWKLISYSNVGRRQLFDLVADPHELHDLSADPQHAAQVAALQQKLDAWFTPRIGALRRASPR